MLKRIRQAVDRKNAATFDGIDARIDRGDCAGALREIGPMLSVLRGKDKPLLFLRAKANDDLTEMTRLSRECRVEESWVHLGAAGENFKRGRRDETSAALDRLTASAEWERVLSRRQRIEADFLLGARALDEDDLATATKHLSAAYASYRRSPRNVDYWVVCLVHRGDPSAARGVVASAREAGVFDDARSLELLDWIDASA